MAAAAEATRIDPAAVSSREISVCILGSDRSAGSAVAGPALW
jgi:hypothetical protein